MMHTSGNHLLDTAYECMQLRADIRKLSAHCTEKQCEWLALCVVDLHRAAAMCIAAAAPQLEVKE